MSFEVFFFGMSFRDVFFLYVLSSCFYVFSMFFFSVRADFFVLVYMLMNISMCDDVVSMCLCRFVYISMYAGLCIFLCM